MKFNKSEKKLLALATEDGISLLQNIQCIIENMCYKTDFEQKQAKAELKDLLARLREFQEEVSSNGVLEEEYLIS